MLVCFILNFWKDCLGTIADSGHVYNTLVFQMIIFQETKTTLTIVVHDNWINLKLCIVKPCYLPFHTYNGNAVMMPLDRLGLSVFSQISFFG